MQKGMDYKVEKEGDQFCVYQISTGKKVEDFPTRRDAMNKIRELLKAPKDEGKNDKKGDQELNADGSVED